MTCAEVGKNENWAYGKALQTGELSYNLAKRLELKHAFWIGQKESQEVWGTELAFIWNS